MKPFQTEVFLLGILRDPSQKYQQFVTLSVFVIQYFLGPFEGETKLQGQSHPLLLPILAEDISF